jgi:hypothetical protein
MSMSGARATLRWASLAIAGGCLVAEDVGAPEASHPPPPPPQGPCAGAADGASCDDGDACTLADSCQHGVCAGEPVVCSLVDACHPGFCDPNTGACSVPDGTACADPAGCDGGASCQRGACVGRFWDAKRAPAWMVHLTGVWNLPIQVATDASAGVTIAASFGTGIDFGVPETQPIPKPPQGYVARYGEGDTLTFHEDIGGADQFTLTLGDHRVFLAGVAQGHQQVEIPDGGTVPAANLFVAELGGWTRAFAAPDGPLHPYVNQMAYDGVGRVVITGSFEDVVDLGAGTTPSAGADDGFVASYDAATGATAWAFTFGDTAPQLSNGVAADANAIVVSGSFQGQVAFGSTVLTSTGADDVFVAKLDREGNAIWSKSFGSSAGNDRGKQVALDTAGNIFMVGEFGGAGSFTTIDFGCTPLVDGGNGSGFVLKLDPTGTCVFSQRFGGPSGAGVWGVGVADGRVLLNGWFFGDVSVGPGTLVSAGMRDVFAAALDTSGKHLWSMRLGSCADDESGVIAADGKGQVYVTGAALVNGHRQSTWLAAIAP